MPKLTPPNTSSNILVSVPVPKPVAQRPVAAPAQPAQQPAPARPQVSFQPMQVPPTLLLPHGEVGGAGVKPRAKTPVQPQQMRRGRPVRFSEKAIYPAAPPFYSLAEKVLQSDRIPNRAQPKQIVNSLLNAGVKPEELKWSGLADLLERATGPLTRKELLDHLRENHITLHEVLKGGDVEPKVIEGNGWESVGGINPDETRYHEYQLPHGRNYREMLLTMPPDDRNPMIAAAKAVEDAQQAYQADNSMENYRRLNEARDAANRIGADWQPPTYNSTHWNEPNVLAHVRFNDRTGENGEKLLHLEELQSDWHQAGREKGYQPTEQEKDRAVVRSKELGRLYSEASARKDAKALADITNEQIALGKILNPRRDLPPDAPFRKTWHELMLRRMIRYAAEHGYDGVSWTPGQEQAERYNLAKHLSAAEWNQRDNVLLAYDHAGKQVVSEKNVPRERLHEYLGHEVADKLAKSADDSDSYWGSVRGLDLHTGGEGMKGFYDKIVPNYLNAFGKRFGAKVGTTTTSTAKIRTRKDGSQVEESHDMEVPYFPITEPMREAAVKQGHALFKRSPRRMGAYSAPAGGMEAQGIYYQGGKRLPAEATQQLASQPAASRRQVRSQQSSSMHPAIMALIQHLRSLGGGRKPQRFAAPKEKAEQVLDLLGPNYLSDISTGEQKKIIKGVHTEAATNLGFADLQRQLDQIGATSIGGKKQAVRDIFDERGTPLPKKVFDPESPKPETTPHIAKALQAYALHGGGAAQKVAILHPEVSGPLRVARAFINGHDEVTHQLQRGDGVSGLRWYTNMVHRLEAGLIALYGTKQKDGSYISKFGNVGADGVVTKLTPHMDLFKMLLASLSPNAMPIGNLTMALKAYDIARQVNPSSPFSSLPIHTGIRRDNGKQELHSVLQENPVDLSLPTFKNDRGKVTPQKKYMSITKAVESYWGLVHRMRAVLENFNGNEDAASRFFFQPQPVSELANLKSMSSLLGELPRENPEARGNSKELLKEHHPGAWLLGWKTGPFAMNLAHLHEHITKDLWFTRSWNRLMGTMFHGDKVVETPRNPKESAYMNHFVKLAAQDLKLTNSEFQAAWWFFEQHLWDSLAGERESQSFADAINARLDNAGIKLPDPYSQGIKPSEKAPLPVTKRRRSTTFAKPKWEVPTNIKQPSHEVYESLRRQAEQLVADGRMPSVEEFLQVLAATLEKLPPARGQINGKPEQAT